MAGGHGGDDCQMRYLPEGDPSVCDVPDCRRDHVAEVEFATNHASVTHDPWAVLGRGDRSYLGEVPHGYQQIVYDPNVWHALTVERELPGFLVASGTTASVLRDDAPVDLLDHLSTVEVAVLSARLRAWADRLDERDTQPRPC